MSTDSTGDRTNAVPHRDYNLLANGQPTNLYCFGGRMYERIENDGLWCFRAARMITDRERYE